MSKTAAFHIVPSFQDNLVIQYEIVKHVLMDNGTQCVSKSFESLCAFLCTRNLTRAAHYSGTNGKAEPFKEMIIAQLRHYVTVHQKEWNVSMQS